jgi:hypothetical protein
MTTTDFETAISADQSQLPETPVGVDVTATGSVLYAMAHNKISPVSRLVVRPYPGVDMQNLQVEVRIDAATGESLSTPWTRHVTELSSDGVSFDRVEVALDAKAMSAFEEQRPGVVTVTTSLEGHAPATVTAPIDVLAHNQWQRLDSWRLSAELLCAFVMPNHPAVGQLLGDAAEILARSTGRSALDGYQDDRDRVHAIARAIWEALQQRRIKPRGVVEVAAGA